MGRLRPPFLMNRPPRDHSHYGPDTQMALRAFEGVMPNYWKLVESGKYNTDLHYLRFVQELWDNLLKARRLETGITTYLSAEEYENVNHR